MQESDLQNDELLNHDDEIKQNEASLHVNDDIIQCLLSSNELQGITKECLQESKKIIDKLYEANTMVNENHENGIEKMDEVEMKLPQIQEIKQLLEQNKSRIIDHILKRRQSKEGLKQWDMEDIQQMQAQKDSDMKRETLTQQEKEKTDNEDNEVYNIVPERKFSIVQKSSNEIDLNNVKKQLVQRLDEIDINILKQFTAKSSQVAMIKQTEPTQNLSMKNNTSSAQPGKIIIKINGKILKQETGLNCINEHQQDRYLNQNCDLYPTDIQNEEQQNGAKGIKKRTLKQNAKEAKIKAGKESDTVTEDEEESENNNHNEQDQRFKPNSKKQAHKTQGKEKIQVTELSVNHSKSHRPKRNKVLRISNIFSNIHNDSSHYTLVSYQNYKSYSAQPYMIYISLEVLIMLNIHSHLSSYEVIGFLGGFCFESKTSNQKYLLIHSAYPCESLIQNQKERQKNVDLCPISADKARQQIHKRGQQLLGWYHSHPFFPVEPSMIDIRNHAVYQQSFDLESMPFVGLIIGPYSEKNRTESLMKIFHLVKNKQPFSLNYKQMPSTKLRKALLGDINEVFAMYANHKDKIDMKGKWTANKTREQKLLDALELIFDKNLATKNKFNLQTEILNNLDDKDINQYFPGQSTNNAGISGSTSSSLRETENKEPANQNEIQHLYDNHHTNENQCQTINTKTNDDYYLKQKKISYFSVENEDKIEKIIKKLGKMLRKTLYGETDTTAEGSQIPANEHI